VEQGAWRWSQRSFTVQLPACPRCLVSLDTHLPAELLPAVLRWSCGSRSGSLLLRQAGAQPLTVPCQLAQEGALQAELDHAMPERAGDQRELGLIVRALSLRAED
jgi:hypothetical protein